MTYLELESATTEWKLSLPENNQIIKTIVGFCNANGGKLIIGINDDGTIIGISDETIHSTLEYLNTSIYQATHPVIIPNIYTQNINGKKLLIIEVSAGMNKPYFIKSQGLEQGTYIRIGRSTVRANASMINELQWLAHGKSFDKMPVYQATLNDLDPQKIQAYIKQRLIKKLAPSENEMLYANNFIIDEHAHTYPTTAGILLLGKNPNHFFPEARIMCAHFSGTTIENKAISAKECTGTLDEQFECAFNFVLGRLNHSWSIKGFKRKEVLEIPQEALREVLLNAMVHRNYHIPAPSKVAIFDDRIEIFSPGGFPGPLNQQNLRHGFTFLRNITICLGFRELGLIETFGLGFQRLFASYETINLRPPQVIDDSNYVKCILPRGPSAELHHPEEDTITSELNAILDLFSQALEITVSDVIHALRIPRTTATRRLTTLTQQKKIKRLGLGRAAHYVKI